MDLIATYEGDDEAVVLAGFGEHGREGVQELLRVPVVHSCEAVAHVAQLLVGPGLGTSKVSTCAPPETKPPVGWPFSAHLRTGGDPR